MSLVDVNPVRFEDSADFSHDGLSSRLYAVVTRHLVNVVTVQLVQVEDIFVLEHGVDVNALCRQTLFSSVIYNAIIQFTLQIVRLPSI